MGKDKKPSQDHEQDKQQEVDPELLAARPSPPLPPTQPASPSGEGATPELVVVLRVLGGLEMLGGFIACVTFWPGTPEYGYEWKAAAYVLSLAWLTAGVVSGLLFISVGEVIRYLRDMRDLLSALATESGASGSAAGSSPS